MKKILFKIIENKNGELTLKDVIAEVYDEFVYYVSPRMNKDFKFGYSLYDKKTGLIVCSGKNKQELIVNYKKVTEKYAQIRESEFYQKAIEQYEELKEKRINTFTQEDIEGYHE